MKNDVMPALTAGIFFLLNVFSAKGYD